MTIYGYCYQEPPFERDYKLVTLAQGPPFEHLNRKKGGNAFSTGDAQALALCH